jgi:hypothetical protein
VNHANWASADCALANRGHDTRALQAYLGHKNIQHTVRYTELAFAVQGFLAELNRSFVRLLCKPIVQIYLGFPARPGGTGKTNGRTSVRPLGDIKIAML